MLKAANESNAEIIDEDVLLMKQIAEKDYPALDKIYEKYRRKVYSTILQIVKTEEDALEIQQDVFLTVWQKASFFDTSLGSFPGWITRIAHNTAINALRSKLTKKKSLEIKHDHQALSELVVEETIERTTALDHQVETDRKNHLHALLKRIPTNQRTVLTMSYYDGYTQTQIAKELGKPLGSVKSQMRQGLMNLRKLVKGAKTGIEL